MHQTLLIDEIFDLILDPCIGTHTLAQVAQTCQAWKDPALNRLWSRLSSFKPLLNLIPGLTLVNGAYALESPLGPDFRRLHHYASRVKQVVYQEKICLHSTLIFLLSQNCETAHLFQKLVTVQLSMTNSSSLGPIVSLAKSLMKVDLNLGYKKDTSTTSNSSAFDFLSNVNRVSSSFQSLSLRGIATSQLMHLVSNLTHLEVLRLRVSTTLSVETLAAVSTFPHLKELEIHISHILPKDVTFSPLVCFPSLQSLNIRGRTDSISKLLHHMQSESLAVLRIDLQSPIYIDNAWTELFAALKEKTHTSLLRLTIEHHMDTPETSLETNTPSSLDTPTTSLPHVNNVSRTNPNDIFCFEHLRSLSNHRSLRQIVFETTPPILIHDSNLEQIVQWWPNLEHLDLGSLSTNDPRWTPKVTPVGLSTLSRGLSTLDTLVIPVNVTGLTSDAAIKLTQNPNNRLRFLTVTGLMPPDQYTAPCLHRLFPSLITVHGGPDHEEAWDGVQTNLESLNLSEKCIGHAK
ncbi:hypothetical protein EV360DRAFT_81771 [Lentinula raphanica]|nr:hypothetical protein EV360DRAFT_81771 [Lentinula raphanica]